MFSLSKHFNLFTDYIVYFTLDLLVECIYESSMLFVLSVNHTSSNIKFYYSYIYC